MVSFIGEPAPPTNSDIHFLPTPVAGENKKEKEQEMYNGMHLRNSGSHY